MKSYNIIVVFDEIGENILLCRRKKDPYRGLSNFVGGKIEPGEDGPSAAYRELEEETSLTKEQITLTHFMDLTYYLYDLRLEVYVGKLQRQAPVTGTENELYWSTLEHDFFDSTQYAGDGNIGHILRTIEAKKDELFR